MDWTPAVATTAYVADGLNRYSVVAGKAFAYDWRDNLQADGANTYSYDVENRLLSAFGPTSVSLSYDPLGRLQQTTAGGTVTQYLYDGTKLAAELDGSGNILRRYVHGPGTDTPIVWYEGANLATRNYLHVNERGSVIATTNSTGAATIYLYRPYGTWHLGRVTIQLNGPDGHSRGAPLLLQGANLFANSGAFSADGSYRDQGRCEPIHVGRQ